MPGMFSRGSHGSVARWLRSLTSDEQAATTVEYALLLTLVVLSAIAAYQALGSLSAGQAAGAAQGIEGLGEGGAAQPGTVWTSRPVAQAALP